MKRRKHKGRRARLPWPGATAWFLLRNAIVQWMPFTRIVERKNGKEFDEVIVKVGLFGRCLMHIETLDDDCVWIGFYAGGERHGLVISARPTLTGSVLEYRWQEDPPPPEMVKL